MESLIDTFHKRRFQFNPEIFVNFFFNPSLPGVLLFFKLVMELNSSVSRILFSRGSHFSFVNVLGTQRIEELLFFDISFRELLFNECFVKRFNLVRYFLAIRYFFLQKKASQFYDKFGRQPFWIWEKICFFHTNKVKSSKEIGVNISIILGYSVFYKGIQ